MNRMTLVPLFVSVVLSGHAGDRFRPEGNYDARVPTPETALGFAVGDRAARHQAIIDYFEQLAPRCPGSRLVRYARSHEGRDLVYLLITSEANLGRIDAIRADVARIADPRPTVAATDLTALLDATPAVAYLAYSIHGDELSGADAAIRVAYELCAGRDETITRIREQLVVLIDPMENPDGRERFLAMTTAYTGSVINPDPDAMAHTAVWPWGRANHYLFDLNRDWFAQVHPESRGRVSILREWHPQLVVDSHEMGGQSTYLFNPPRSPFNPNLPGLTLDWWRRFASDHARAFDGRGWSYYTGDWNEEFFPGYGSALPLYTGAVGILYEQAGNEGSSLRKLHGGTLEYFDAVHHQFVSSLANLETAARNRRELLARYRDARAEAVNRGATDVVKTFYFAARPHPQRARLLAQNLRALGIEVDQLNADSPLPEARTPWTHGRAQVPLPAGSFRVRLDQPNGLLARAVLEPHTPMTDAVIAQEREHLERQKGTRLYDTTAWSPLLASGLDVYWSARPDKLAWSAATEAKPTTTPLANSAAGYGFVWKGDDDGALILAAKLATLGHVVRVGDLTFTLEKIDYPRGSFLIRNEENKPTLADDLRALAIEHNVEVNATPTAKATHGPDLGADRYTMVRPARIAIVAGSPTDFTSVGAAWHLLDKRQGLRVSLLDATRVSDADLSRYNVIVLPNTWDGASAWSGVLGKSGIGALREWVTRGGTLVGLAGGAEFLATADNDLSAVRMRADRLEDFPAPRFGLDDAQIRALERFQAIGLGASGKAVASAGHWGEDDWPGALAIPGAGSPILGPGVWATFGDVEAATLKQRWPPQAIAPPSEKAEKVELSKEEQELARKRIDERLRRFAPSGAILRADLDDEQWITWGAGDRTAVMVRGDAALIARDPVRTAARFAAPAELHLGGLLWPEAAGRIAHTAFITRESRGRGQLILFADDPNFRGYFWGTERLFLNAVLLGPALGTDESIPW